METLDFRIVGMTCDHCASSLQTALGKVRGIRNATVSYSKHHASVDIDASIQAESVIQTIRAKGYDAQLSNQQPTPVSSAGAALKVVIIGSGSASFAAALRAVEEGATVTIIEAG